MSSAASRSPKGSWCLPVVVFFTVLIWTTFLIQGLPIGDLDDWDHILFAQDVDWKVLVANIIRPWSESPFWYGQGSFEDHVIHERVVPTLILKCVSSVFHLKSFPFYFLYKVLFFAGTTSLLFILLRRVAASGVIAFCGTLFYLFVPVHYLHTLWISDPVTLVHFFVLLGITIYLDIYNNLVVRGSFTRFLVLTLALFLTGWVGIKSKSVGLILPLVIVSHTLTTPQLWKVQKTKTVTLLAVLALIAIQVVPIAHITAHDNTSFLASFRLKNIIRMLLLQSDTTYGNEAIPAFFSLEHIFPASVSRALGFLTLWTIILFSLLYHLRKRGKKLLEQDFFIQNAVIQVALIWILIEISLMGFFLPESRFFSGTFIPITILLTRLVYCVFRAFKWPVQLFVMFFPVCSFFWHGVIENVQHVVWLRIQKGTDYSRFLNVAKAVYHDLYPEAPLDLREIASFYSLKYVPQNWVHKMRMDDVMFYSDFALEDWRKTSTHHVSEIAEYAQGGAQYTATFSNDPYLNMAEFAFLQTISGINADSIFERVTFQLKRKRPRPMHVFKWVGNGHNDREHKSLATETR